MRLPPIRHAIYLHGFASSPGSSKARRFAGELAARGVGFSCPDFNLPRFETLTVSRMLGQVAGTMAAVANGPVTLIGSSLGAFVAIHAAAQDRTGLVDRLVLLAPALDFGGNRLRRLGEHGVEAWRRTGRLRVFHYSANEEREIGFTLYEDAARYDAWSSTLAVPTLVFQGRRDETVDPAMVERWAAGQPRVALRWLDDGHQLAESIDVIWSESAEFFGVASTTARPA
jgi:uncharacterized protein